MKIGEWRPSVIKTRGNGGDELANNIVGIGLGAPCVHECLHVCGGGDHDPAASRTPTADLMRT